MSEAITINFQVRDSLMEHGATNTFINGSAGNAVKFTLPPSLKASDCIEQLAKILHVDSKHIAIQIKAERFTLGDTSATEDISGKLEGCNHKNLAVNWID